MGKPWKNKPTITDLVLTTLLDEARPLSPQNIYKLLKKQNRQPKGKNTIQSSLRNLKEKGVVEQAGFAQYLIADNEKARIAVSESIDKVVMLDPIPDQSNAVLRIDPSMIEKTEPEPKKEEGPISEESDENVKQDDWKSIALELIRNQQRTIELLATKDANLIIHGEKV